MNVVEYLTLIYSQHLPSLMFISIFLMVKVCVLSQMHSASVVPWCKT